MRTWSASVSDKIDKIGSNMPLNAKCPGEAGKQFWVTFFYILEQPKENIVQSQNTIDEEILFNGEETGNHEMRSNYSEVRRRRVLAFIVDYIIIAILCVPAAALIGFAGILTFGLGWILYAAMVPLVVFAYLGLTMGGENQATIGMSMFSIHIRRLDGCIVDAPLAILHGILFWFLHSVLSPFMLLASLFSSRKRLLQDWLLGTEVVYRDHG